MEASGTHEDMHMGELISQCAESKVYRCHFYGVPAVSKHRFEKQYRHPKLDRKLREQRTVREARALVRCRSHGVRTPAVYAVDKKLCRIIMEHIHGSTVKAVIDSQARVKEEERDMALVVRLLTGIGEMTGLLHNADIIHGDLTTSNFMLVAPDEMTSRADSSSDTVAPVARDGLVVLDFGLVADKNSPEERAVDLYLLERAITSTHPFVGAAGTNALFEGYERTVEPKRGSMTLSRLKVVRARGRKRSMIG